jgi:hypothetical protein
MLLKRGLVNEAPVPKSGRGVCVFGRFDVAGYPMTGACRAPHAVETIGLRQRQGMAR